MKHWISLLIAWALVSAAKAQGPPPGVPDAGAQNGISVDFSMIPLQGQNRDAVLREGADVAVRFHLYDALTGAPITGVQPSAWMDLKDRALEPASCSNRVKEFLEGGTLSKPDIDMNDYLAITLGQGPVVTIYDPRFETGRPRKITRIALPGPGADWVLTADGRLLFVSIPSAKSVLVIDTSRWVIVSTITTSQPPKKLVTNARSSSVWAAGESEVYALSIADLRLFAEVKTGAGLRDLALSSDAETLFAASETASEISIIDTAKGTLLDTIKVSDPPVAIDYSEASGSAWAAGDVRGMLYAVRRSSKKTEAAIQTSPGVVQFRFAPGGRYGFAVNAKTNQIEVIDSATRTIIQSAHVKEMPLAVAFSTRNAYVQHGKDETVTVIPLDSVGVPGKPVSTVDLPAGQYPIPASTSAADPNRISPTPAGDAVLVSNSRDPAVYYYQEGMATTMGLVADDSSPRAILVLDRSLRARSPGNYETVARLGGAGNYIVAMALSNPSVVRCFDVAVSADPSLLPSGQRRKVLVRPIESQVDARSMVSATVRMRLIDASTGEPARSAPDVRLLVAAAGGNWFRKFHALDSGDGIYSAVVVVPLQGFYYLSAESRSLELPSGESARWMLRATDPQGAPNAK